MTMMSDQGTGMDICDGPMASDLAVMLAERGFEVDQPAGPESGRLVITGVPVGRCEIDVIDNGWMTCDYLPPAGERTRPADITQAVLRLLDVSSAGSADEPGKPCPGVALKRAVGYAARAWGLHAELQLSPDNEDLVVYADVEITNPGQPGRGTVLVNDEGSIWWEVNVGELTGQAREFVTILTDVLTSPT